MELHERAGVLGGQFRLAGAAPSKEEIHSFIRFLVRRVERSGVRVVLDSELNREAVDRIAPDVVIVATGARPATIPVPGAETALLSWDVLDGKVDAGNRVAVIGGGQVGCETAEYLAERGRAVTVLEMLPEVAADMGARQREPFLKMLVEMGIDFITRAKVTSIGSGTVSYDRAGLAEKLLGIDTVVMAVGSRADASLAEALRGGPWELRVAGDCVKSRTGLDAVHEGFFAGAEA